MEPSPRWNKSPYQQTSPQSQSNWQSPRFNQHQNHLSGGRGRSFGYGNNNPQGRFRSPNSPHNFSPRGNYHHNPNPRFIDYSNPYGGSAGSPYQQNQNQHCHTPRHHTPRHFSPRTRFNYNSPDSGGQQQFRSNKNRSSRDSIESWIHPDMWADPWADLRAIPTKETESLLVTSASENESEPHAPPHAVSVSQTGTHIQLESSSNRGPDERTDNTREADNFPPVEIQGHSNDEIVLSNDECDAGADSNVNENVNSNENENNENKS